jgi:hypothetical protein
MRVLTALATIMLRRRAVRRDARGNMAASLWWVIEGYVVAGAR